MSQLCMLIVHMILGKHASILHRVGRVAYAQYKNYNGIC